MAGIYFHIPYCKQACIYCNFHFSTSLKSKAALVSALGKEMELQKDFFVEDQKKSDPVIQTVYFGGGTPSLLSAEEIVSLLRKTGQLFSLASDAEVTLEGNPDDLDKEKLQSLKKAGINRLSIGIQSFFDEDLQWMNRAHNANQALQCIQDVRETGFLNFSADLIYGTPTLTDKRWQENMDQMIAMQVPHLSCYALTLEPHTPLEHFIRHKKYPPLDEIQSARQFEMLMESLEAAGYTQYEISNFALPRQQSKHNSNYWKGIPYLGIGPSAHSFTGKTRQWNVANNALYIRAIEEDKIPSEKEILSPVMQLNEYIMTSLRTTEGCRLDVVEAKWGNKQSQRLEIESEKFISDGQMILQSNHLVLTRKGKLFTDRIASELFA